MIGSISPGKRCHQRLAVYPIVPISAARHTGISPPTMIVNPKILTAIILIRTNIGKLRIKSEINMISIIIFPPLTTIRCISPDALRCSLSSGLIALLCQSKMPERIEYHGGGKSALSRSSNHRCMRTVVLYLSGVFLEF